MENLLEVQKSLYGPGVDGPPMIFEPEASAFQLETVAPRPAKRSKTGLPQNEMQEKQTERKKSAVVRRDLFAQLKAKAKPLPQQLAPCQMPGDFPPELSFRAMAAYSLLRTLSIQLRLSPFAPNVFLRALYLPIPTRLLGEVHVAILRILFAQKLKNMGYSYKAGGGGVGVHKKRQHDNIRWPLLAGDNLTHLDIYSWPLFYDDYCHLTADRLWASYHGPLEPDSDDAQDHKNYIDFRNIGLFGSSPGHEYRTKQCADGVTLPAANQKKYFRAGYREAKTAHGQGKGECAKQKESYQDSNDEIFLSKKSQVHHVKRGDADRAATTNLLHSDHSKSEEEYTAGDDDDDNDEDWTNKPKPKKKRRRVVKKNVSAGSISIKPSISAHMPKAAMPGSTDKEQQMASVPNHWSRITSSPPKSAPTLASAINDGSTPSWSRITSLEPSPQKELQPNILPQSATTQNNFDQKEDVNKPTKSVQSLGDKSQLSASGLINTNNNNIDCKQTILSSGLSMTTSLLVKVNGGMDMPSEKDSTAKIGADCSRPIRPTDTPNSMPTDSDVPRYIDNFKDPKKETELSNTITQSTTDVQHDPAIAPKESSSSELLLNSTSDSHNASNCNQNTENNSTDISLVVRATHDIHDPTAMMSLQAAVVTEPGAHVLATPGQHSSRPNPTNVGQPGKCTESDLICQQSQQIQEEEKETDNNILRIRGGGGADDSKTNKSFNSGVNMQKMGRPRGSRRALPIHNRTGASRTTNLPMHRHQFTMPPLQQQSNQQQSLFQQQEYRFYQAQIKARAIENFGKPITLAGINSITSGASKESPSQLKHLQFLNALSNQELHPLKKGRFEVEDHRELLDAPYLVPDDVRDAINAFVYDPSSYKRKATNVEVLGDDDHHSVHKRSDKEDLFEKELERDLWLHFKPLKAMRSGIPYHRLPPEDKINMLEFLIDELLTVDAISAEFQKRRIRTEYHETPYGSLPDEEEYKNLDNNDECAVCGQEGDLLCCDGCVSSYHRGCLNMNAGQSLPEGKWLCPECSLVDPCTFGTMRGGRKSELDWFTVDDVVKCCNKVSPCTSQGFVSESPLLHQSSFKNHNPPSVIGVSDNKRSGDAIVKITTESRNNKDQQNLKEKELLVVHGFVFCRKLSSSNQFKPYTALSKKDLEDLLSQVGERVSKAWPLIQVPSADQTSSFPSLNTYFNDIASFNPCLYRNKYNSAPISLLTKVGAVHNMTKMMHQTYESECNKLNTSKLSEILSEDMSLDAEISRCLETQATLFDPFQILKTYMLKLELTLKKSCMINEFWEGGHLKSRSEIWASRVRSARSIRGLSRLLLKLVNAIHAKAFTSAWVHSHVSKSHDSEGSTSDRNYKVLPSDWSEEKEKLKHRWEMTPSNMIFDLCISGDNDLMAFATGIRSDIFIAKQISVIKSKRKRKKFTSSSRAKGLETENLIATSKPSICVGVEQQPKKSKAEDLNTKTTDPERIAKNEANASPRIETTDQATSDSFDDREIDQINANSMPRVESNVANGTFDVLLSTEEKPEVPKPPIPVGIVHSNNEIMKNSSNATNLVNIFKEPEDPDQSKMKGESDEAPGCHTTTKAEQDSSSKQMETTEEKQAENDNDLNEEKVDTRISTSTSSAKKKKRRQAKSRPREPSSRRHTRRSGRLSSEFSVECSRNASILEAGDLSTSTMEPLGGMALQIENSKKEKIPGLEKLVKGQYAVQGIWPIAGRQIFPTIGNLPPGEMKRLAKNAGSALAANLSYHTNHEVAQVCYGHIWRKRVASCGRFEELLHLIRVLESSLDREMIHQSENQTKRGKTKNLKVVQITMRNPSSGSLEHFVVNKKTNKGCWVPAEQLDVSSLIADLFLRRQRQREERLKRVNEEKKLIEYERNKRIAEAVKKAEEDKRKQEAARAAVKRKKKEEKEKKRLEQQLKKKARLLAEAHAQKASDLVMKKFEAQSDVSNWKKQINYAFESHELRTEYALSSWINRGSSTIPDNELIEIRKRTLVQLRKIMDKLRQLNESVMTDQQLITRMFDHEHKVALRCQSKKPTMNGMGNSENLTFATSANAGNKESNSSSAIHDNRDDNVNSFSGQNVATRFTIAPGSNEQEGPNQLSMSNGNPNPKQVSPSDKFPFEDNTFSSQSIPNQIQSAQSSHGFDKRLGEYGMRNNAPGQMGLISQSFDIKSQQSAGVNPSRIRLQNPTSIVSSSTPSKQNFVLNGSFSRDNNAFSSSVPVPVPKQGAFSSMESTQQGRKFSQSPNMKAQQQHQHQFSMHQLAGQYDGKLDFQSSTLAPDNSAQQLASGNALQPYQNMMLGRQDQQPAYQQMQQAGIQNQNFQSYPPNMQSRGALFGNSNGNRQASGGTYTGNILSHQSPISNQHAAQHLNSDRQNQSPFSVRGVANQPQHHVRSHNDQYAHGGMNYLNPPMSMSRAYDPSYGVKLANPDSHRHQAKSLPQPQTISRPAVAMGYQQTQAQEVGNQQGVYLFSAQRSVQQPNNFAQFDFRQPSQSSSNTQSMHPVMAMASQHQELNQTSYQGHQQSKLQPPQHQFHHSLQNNEMYGAQQQRQQQQQNTQTQGQFNPDSFENIFF